MGMRDVVDLFIDIIDYVTRIGNCPQKAGNVCYGVLRACAKFNAAEPS